MQSSFGEALLRLWPNGDERVTGLRAGMIATAPAVFQRYGISSPLLIAHVMAQISHECGAGHDVVENLNYTAFRMMQVWPSRFPTLASASPYAGNPRALANNVYGSRMGNTGPDDGWKFRGRGASQTTGREGYAKLSAKTGLDLINHPELLNDPKFFLECGVADFILCGCLPYARADDVLGVTKKLNGGTVGLNERKIWLSKWKAANIAPFAPVILSPVPYPMPPDVPKPLPPSITNPARGSVGAAIASLFAFIASLFKKGK